MTRKQSRAAPGNGGADPQDWDQLAELINPKSRRSNRDVQPESIRGFRSLCPSNNLLGRQRGFKGASYGPAGPCRSFSLQERQVIEAELRKTGRL
jgi:hypothetical protein